MAIFNAIVTGGGDIWEGGKVCRDGREEGNNVDVLRKSGRRKCQWSVFRKRETQIGSEFELGEEKKRKNIKT